MTNDTRGSRPLRYVALGDSYTIGTSVEAADRWPDQLVRRLAAGGSTVPLELVANLGVDGYTSADLIRDELPELASLRPGFVSVLIGVNDVVQGVSPSRYAANLAAIFDALAVHVPADRTVAVGTPDYTVTPAGADYGEPVARRAAIEACNGLLDRVARSRGITVVGTWDISRRAATEISLVARDGLHPSGRQYELWVDAIAPAVERLLAPG